MRRACPPGPPARWRAGEIGAPATLLFRKGDVQLRFFSTITTFGTPRDVTLEELHIECSFPADESTAAACRAIGSEYASRPVELRTGN